MIFCYGVYLCKIPSDKLYLCSGTVFKTKITLGRTDGPSPSRENLYTQIINIILSCINATKTCNTAIERQLCELFKSVRFLKLTLLLKYTGRFK